MADFAEYAQRIVNAINLYGESVNLKYRVSTYDPVQGETFTYKTYKNYKMFIRPTEKKDWETLPEGLKLKDIRKVYFTKKLPKKELIIQRISDGKDYEIIVPPEDNIFDGRNYYYKCYIAVKEVNNDPD